MSDDEPLSQKSQDYLAQESQEFRDFLTDLWQSGVVVRGRDPFNWRRDLEGNLIKWSEFRNPSSEYGWREVYKVPLEAGGADTVRNMRPRCYCDQSTSSDGPIAGFW